MLGPGSELAGLRIEALIGRGAMGEVYRAEQLALHRTVAVKRIAPHLAQEPELIARFAREARIVARISDPHVVAIHDFVQATDAQGTPHALLVMEWVEGGRNLKQFIAPGLPLPWIEACAVVRHLARGLAAAAAAGVVHRDIKPANVLIASGGIAKLADFGLATASDLTTMTMDGAIVGTPTYLSPEACQGAAPGPASDVYSLGATWFHLLVGRPPFEAASTVAMLRAHCDDPVPHPEQDCASLPPAVTALVRRCLAKQPSGRPPLPELLAGLDAIPGIPERLHGLVARGPCGEATTIPTARPAAGSMTRLAATPPTQPMAQTVVQVPANAVLVSNAAAPPGPDSTATQVQPAPAPTTTVPSAGSRRRSRIPLAIGALAVVLGTAIPLGLSFLRSDPLAHTADTVQAALASGDLALALTTASAAVAAHPDRSEGHALVRAVIDAEVAALVAQARFAEALSLVTQRKSAHAWLRTEAWDQQIRLAEADFVFARGGRSQAEDLHLELHKSYPVDIPVRLRYLRDFGRSGEREASRHGESATTLVAQAEPGELPSLVGDSLLDHLHRHGSYHERAQPLRELLLTKYRAPTIAAARARLADEDGSARIGAFHTLRQAGELGAAEELRFHVFFALEDRWSDQHAESVAWVEQAAAGVDWNERKKSAGLTPVAAIPVFDEWSDQQLRVSRLLRHALLPECVDLLQRLTADAEHSRSRWNAWSLLHEIGIAPDIDAMAFHATTLTTCDPSWTSPDIRAAVDHFRAARGGRDDAACRTALAAGVTYLDRVIANGGDDPQWRQTVDGAKSLQAELKGLSQ